MGSLECKTFFLKQLSLFKKTIIWSSEWSGFDCQVYMIVFAFAKSCWYKWAYVHTRSAGQTLDFFIYIEYYAGF